MTDLKLDDDGDLALEGNSLVLISGGDEVAQRLLNRLRLWRGEWFLNLNRGTPYREEIFVKRTALSRIESAIKREILTTSGVLELLEYTQDLDIATRRLTVSFKAKATDGTIVEFNEVLP
jgi:hypothetical protein